VKKIVLIAQERNGLLKVAPLFTILKRHAVVEPVPVLVVRGGEGEDNGSLARMLGLEEHLVRVPLEAGTPVGETAALMLAFEKLFDELSADLVVPGGYDNAAVAATFSASRMGIPVVSLDAGLRSYDRSDPGEINRLIIDSVAALLFVSEHSGIYNLMNEGVADERVLFAGNTSIDSLVALMGEANRSGILEALDVQPRKFATVLLDMPLRAETERNREQLCKVLESLAATTTVLLPCGTGPENGVREAFGDISGLRAVTVPGPADLLRLLKESAFVLTDSDAFESELTVMNVPCLTMLQASCRPSTIEIGTNVLVGCDEHEILERASVILSGKTAARTLIPEKWDGAAAERVAEVLEKLG
jgi:UDP-N-acetylglucosamine 2-epimerase (non-hydrolysing)